MPSPAVTANYREHLRYSVKTSTQGEVVLSCVSKVLSFAISCDCMPRVARKHHQYEQISIKSIYAQRITSHQSRICDAACE